ncbi:putative dehydrogenase [Halobacteroides halobius DSM 5150]|uniref:Putative dehydrogenase n=1 Tax=Halobacteroides halobius (strain ATCC 35273 / DSM 5150 / MD-1) TaxID=748449 RepID=L0K6K0_HALHC|nr:SDR family NAD(P)-dependent oxidoreductase [Halobacteroides halobius]AGB40160.1 putative dehydrogenase [Halobacteroides halobius DSM 5150]
MNRFAFIIHPLKIADVARKFPICDKLPKSLVKSMVKLLPPFKASDITGVRSKLGPKAEGWFIACPLTSQQMLELPTSVVIEKIVDAGLIAQELGADILGLGAFTSVVGDKGVTIANQLDIPVTTGNSYTVATALEGVKLASEISGVNMKNSNILVVGASGSIGKACTKLLAEDNNSLILAARKKDKLERLAQRVKKDYNVQVKTTTNLDKYLPQSDIIIAASSAVESLININLLKPGTIVCDVARPRDVAKEVNQRRSDVLIIDGGIVEVPGEVNFNLDFGFPDKTAYACMAETMILALEEKYDNYSLGSELEIDKVLEINKLANKHGFKLASLRNSEREVTLKRVNKVRQLISST